MTDYLADWCINANPTDDTSVCAHFCNGRKSNCAILKAGAADGCLVYMLCPAAVAKFGIGP